MIRRWLKPAAERGLVWSGAARGARARHARDVMILAYHDIVPRGEPLAGDRSLHLPQDAFAAQLDALAATHDVLPLGEALDTAASGTRRPRAVITFDDAYAGAVACGVAELVARRLPATIFTAPALLDGRPFWWDLLADASGQGLPAHVRERGLVVHAGRGERILADLAMAPDVPDRLPPHARGASEADLLRAAAQPGITIASHSWSHANLARLGAGEMTAELERPLRWLAERGLSGLPVLSYPYGLSSPVVERAARAAGYQAALLIAGGWYSPELPDRFAVPRVDVPGGVSLRGFELRAAGFVA